MKLALPDLETDDINLAPLIDCVFLLLIFFMVATTFEKPKDDPNKVMELFLTLPLAEAAMERDPEFSDLVIQLGESGHIAVAGVPVGMKDLHQTLKRLAARDRNAHVRIDGASTVQYQNVVHLLDLCQFVGLNNIGVRVR